jgi:hypothetical protein
MAAFTNDGELLLLETFFKTTGVELCLAFDAELTELNSYSRVELSSVMGSVADGAISNDTEIVFDTESETASWWFVADPTGTPVCFGPLPSPQTGNFRFQPGAIRFEAISGG